MSIEDIFSIDIDPASVETPIGTSPVTTSAGILLFSSSAAGSPNRTLIILGGVIVEGALRFQTTGTPG